MRYAVYLPTAREFADARLLGELAANAESAGWDGVFVWDVIALTLTNEPWPLVDAWVTLGAIAAATTLVRIGPMVTAIARRRPAKLARESVTVDRMSNGRLILGVGLGADEDSEFELLGEDPDAHVRAQKLDEGLELLTRLWSGERVNYRGRHFRVRRTTFIPRPVQAPRIPIWVGGLWPNKAPFRRALRWDGFFPTHPNWPDEVLTPGDYRTMRDASKRERGDKHFDLVFTTTLAGDRPTRAEVRTYEEAGVTWWVQSADTLAKMRETIKRGPPR